MSKMISMIFAIDQDNLVGDSTKKFGLPWHYPVDLKFYQTMTTGKKTIMGRKTCELIGKALPNRETYVLTSNKNYKFPGATTINNIEQILELNKEEEIMIVGGVKVFECMINYADKLYITRIHKSHQGDAYYHHLDLSNFKLINTKKDGELEFQEWIKN